MKKLGYVLTTCALSSVLLLGCNTSTAARIIEEPVAVPVKPNWKSVIETQITHDSNIEGFYNKDFGITVGYSGQIFTTNDGAATFSPAQNESYCRFCLDIVDENLAWSGGNGNHIRVSKDGGKTWTAVTDIELGSIHSNIDFLDDTTGWVCNAKKCAATNDGGNTWTLLSLPEDLKAISAIALRTETDGYILSDKGILYTTSDGGISWTQKDTGLMELGVANELGKPGLLKANTTVADMNFYDEQTGLLVVACTIPGEGNYVYSMYTTDGGTTWSQDVVPVKEGLSVTHLYLSGDGKYLTLGTLSKDMLVYCGE